MEHAKRLIRSLEYPPQCLNCPTRHLAEWSFLTDREMELVESCKTVDNYPRGKLIFEQNQPCTGIFCIRAGTVVISKPHSGKGNIYIRLVHAGQTLGYRNLLNGRQSMVCSNSAKALTASVVCHLDLAALSTLFSQFPRLERKFQEHMAEDLDSMEESVVGLASIPVRNRLARLLVSLMDRYATPEEGNGAVMTPPMTWRDMSELLCTRPETLTRTLHAMETDGIFHHKGHTITIDDLERLRHETHPH